MDKQRFKELYRLAHGGDMVAKADLWLEFGFAFDHDPIPAFMAQPALSVSPASSRPCRTAGVSPASPSSIPPASKATDNLRQQIETEGNGSPPCPRNSDCLAQPAPERELPCE